jgi:hypothetical protein
MRKNRWTEWEYRLELEKTRQFPLKHASMRHAMAKMEQWYAEEVKKKTQEVEAELLESEKRRSRGRVVGKGAKKKKRKELKVIADDDANDGSRVEKESMKRWHNGNEEDVDVDDDDPNWWKYPGRNATDEAVRGRIRQQSRREEQEKAEKSVLSIPNEPAEGTDGHPDSHNQMVFLPSQLAAANGLHEQPRFILTDLSDEDELEDKVEEVPEDEAENVDSASSPDTLEAGSLAHLHKNTASTRAWTQMEKNDPAAAKDYLLIKRRQLNKILDQMGRDGVMEEGKRRVKDREERDLWDGFGGKRREERGA